MDIIKLLKFRWMRYKTKIEAYPVMDAEVERHMIRVSKSDGYVECTDVGYMTTDLETIKKLVPLVPVRFQKWSIEEHDCDNFALEFYTLMRILFPRLPIGMCHVERKGGRHAANFIIYKNKSGSFGITFIEPQEGKVSFYSWRPYMMVC